MTEKIKSSLIFEILGRPKEHIIDSMNQLIDVIGKEKGVTVANKNVHEAKEVENKDKDGKIIPVTPESQFFSTFAEVDLETQDIIELIRICFKFLPAHVEIIQPDDIVLNNFNATSVLNEIVTKLHNYDAIAKAALIQNQILAKKFQEMSQNPGQNAGKIQVIERPKNSGDGKEEPGKKRKVRTAEQENQR